MTNRYGVETWTIRNRYGRFRLSSFCHAKGIGPFYDIEYLDDTRLVLQIYGTHSPEQIMLAWINRFGKLVLERKG